MNIRILVGEAQQIDRIIEQFSIGYCHENAEIFDNPDKCYVFCFGLMMLQTSLHNPNVKPGDRMSLKSFIHLFDGMENEYIFPNEILVASYKAIKKESIETDEDCGSSIAYFNPGKFESQI